MHQQPVRCAASSEGAFSRREPLFSLLLCARPSVHPLSVRLNLAALLLTFWAPAFGLEQAPAEFYSGKTIEIGVSSTAGGGYDTHARLLARHMPKHIPGHPTMVVKNVD